MSLATVAGLEPHVATLLAIVLVIILHVRIQLNWERQYGVPLPWGVWINALPVTIASAIAYSQANMSRTAFVANWLQLHRRWYESVRSQGLWPCALQPILQLHPRLQHGFCTCRQDKDKRIDRIVAEKEHADYERRTAELQLSPVGRGCSSALSSAVTAATPPGHMRPIWGAASAAATSEASSAWPAGARPVEQYEDRPACFPLH